MLFFKLSCVSDGKSIDLDGPEFLFYTFTEDKVVFQFNEPLLSARFYRDDQEIYSVDNEFPVANLYINEGIFKKGRGELSVRAADTSGNSTFYTIPGFIINPGTARLRIEELRIRYTRKKDQYIRFSAVEGGSLLGYSLVLFLRGKRTVVVFEDRRVENGQVFDVALELDESVPDEEYRLDLVGDKGRLVLKNRLPQSASCLILRNYRLEVDDYFLYYNSKEKSLDEYKVSSYYKHLVHEVGTVLMDPVWVDINGTTSRKVIGRKENSFYIKSPTG